MFDSRRTIRRVVAAAVVATLDLPAAAADLLPPPPPSHRPHGPPGHRPVIVTPPVVPVVPPDQAPRGAASSSPTGERAEGARTGWQATNPAAGTAADFPTDPSGVAGDKQFDPAYQFSPDWLKGTAGGR